nr:ribosomal protein S10 [Navicula sp.]
MSNFTILLYSKNKNTLNHFLNFFKKSEKQNLRITKKLVQKKKKIKRVSILKSPHVNKTAQKHFQYIYFCVNLSFKTHELQKNLVFLKKVKNQLFPDLKIIIKGTHNKKELFSFKKLTFYCQKLKKKNQKQFITVLEHKNFFAKAISHLKILDYYGKIPVSFKFR